MADSRFTKGLASTRNVAAGTGIGGKSTRLELNKDFLTAEHYIQVSVSQAFTGAPTSSDVRKFIDTLEFTTSTGGKLFSATGAQMYDLGRFTENSGVPQVTLAATSSASFVIPLHHEMDGAFHDMLTAIRSGDESSISLNINWAADAANGFVGGTVPLSAAYTVSVESRDFPSMTQPKGQWGNSPLGASRHYLESQNGRTGTLAGKVEDILLTCGNKTRFILLHTTNTATGAFSDAILDTIRLDMGNGVVRDTTAFSVQQSNIRHRLTAQIPGLYVVDFGDDEAGWLDLRNVSECRLKLSAKAGTPAFRIEVAQDYIR